MLAGATVSDKAAGCIPALQAYLLHIHIYPLTTGQASRAHLSRGQEGGHSPSQGGCRGVAGSAGLLGQVSDQGHHLVQEALPGSCKSGPRHQLLQPFSE